MDFQELERLPQAEKISRANQMLAEFAQSQAMEPLLRLLQHLIVDESPQVSRPILVQFTSGVMSMLAPELEEAVGERCVEWMIGRQSSTLDEPLSNVRSRLSECYQSKGALERAAELLKDNVAISNAGVDDAQRAELFVRIAVLSLRCDTLCKAHCVTAEDFDRNSAFKAAVDFTKRAAALQNKIVNMRSQLDFRICDASILDFTGQFLKAAEKFDKLATMPTLPESERVTFLARAVNCVFLAPAGPQRSRLLNNLYKDERASRLPCFDVLESMFLDRLVKGPGVEKVAESLEAHQRPHLAQSIMMHNLLAASKVYDNITFSQLGELLGVSPDEAEDTASNMIVEGRMAGTIDQIGGCISFASGAMHVSV